MRIRAALPGDLPRIRELLGLLDPELPPLEALQAAFAQVDHCPCAQVYVAEAEEGVVATYTLYLLPNLGHGGRPFAVMESVAVAREAQGKGIGTLLVRHALGEARRAGAYKLALSSALHREAAHRFYQALGFRVYGLSLAVDPKAEG